MNIGTRKPLRLWPGVVIVAIQWLVRYVLPVAIPGTTEYAVIGGVFAGLAVALWWLFFSRAPWLERFAAVVLMPFALFVTSRFVHVSIAQGAEGYLFLTLAVPILSLAFVAWAVGTRHLPNGIRWITMTAVIAIASGSWILVKTGGFTADFRNDLQWRWTKTSEERLLAQTENEPVPIAPPQSALETTKQQPTPEIVGKALQPAPASKEEFREEAQAEAVWPGFRGLHRDDIVNGVRINTDWTSAPPVLLWRRQVGPGWSSFSVRGDLIYTQEQRGPDELVSCYKLSTGKPVWMHRDQTRFWESNGGPGPRGTPSISKGRVYSFGATGILNALNASSGAVVWSHNAATDSETKIPQWGFASSPLILDNTVIVAVAGRPVAYDANTGALRWSGPAGGASYSSPHLFTVDGVGQVLLLSEAGLSGFAPESGKLLWKHDWKGYAIVQPAITAEGDILISVSESSGIRRLGIEQKAGSWSVEERWTSKGLKPYFNDFVVHKGHAFGFDGSILSCIDLKDGTRKWKGGRYGNGQLLLLPDQDLLLVSSEEGELALVQAAPDQFKELAKFPAIEGKTWNHPVLSGDILLVRNGQEMAAFRLTPENQ